MHLRNFALRLSSSPASNETTMATRVLFYYDTVSPWSFFAFEVIKRYQHAWNLQLVLKPIFLGGIMAGESQRSPPGVSPPRDAE